MNLLLAYIRLLTRHSRLIFAVSAALVLASAWLAAQVKFEFSLEELFRSDSPELARYQEFVRRFGEENRVVFIAYQTADVFEPADRAAAARLSDALKKVPAVARVFGLPALAEFADKMSRSLRLPGLYDAALLRHDLTASAVARGFLCSADATAACLLVELAEQDAEAERGTLDAVRAVLAEETERTGIRFHLAGVPVIEAEYGHLIRRDFFTILPASILLVLVLLALYFRNLTGTALLMGTVFASVGGTLALLRLLDIPIGILTNMVPTMIIVVGISESIHVLSHYQEELGHALAPRDAMARTVLYMTGACFLTSLTNALGFGTMMTSGLDMMRVFGWTTAAGILISYLAAVVLLPTMLELVPPRRLQVGFAEETGRVVSSRLIAVVARINRDRRGVVFAVLAVVLAASAYGMSRIQVRSTWLQDMRPESEIAQAHAFLDRKLSSVFTTDFWIKTDGLEDIETLRALERFESALAGAQGFRQRISWTGSLADMMRDANAWLAREEHVLRTFGPALLRPDAALVAKVRQEMLAFDLEPHRVLPADAAHLHRAREFLEQRSPDHELLARFVDADWKDAHLSVRMTSDSSELGRFVAWAQTMVPPGSPLREVNPTGKSYMAKAVLDTTISNSLWSTVQLAVVLFVMFALIFRSLGVGVMAMAPNLIPPVITAGLMGLLGVDLNYSTVTTFAITLGLTVENTVQYLMRYRVEVLADGDPAAAMHRALESAGKPMIFSNGLLIAGFSVGLLSSSTLTRNFGMLGMVSIAAATLADVFVTAALPLVFPPDLTRWRAAEEKLAQVRARLGGGGEGT